MPNGAAAPSHAVVPVGGRAPVGVEGEGDEGEAERVVRLLKLLGEAGGAPHVALEELEAGEQPVAAHLRTDAVSVRTKAHVTCLRCGVRVSPTGASRGTRGESRATQAQ